MGEALSLSPSRAAREPGENPGQTRCCVSPRFITISGAIYVTVTSPLLSGRDKCGGKAARKMGMSQKTCP